MKDLTKGEYVSVIYDHGGKRMAQGYVRYVDKRYLILGMGFRDDWVNIERDDIVEIRRASDV